MNPGTRLSPSGRYQVCNRCDAVENGNASCWACVERWNPPAPELLEVLLRRDRAALIDFLEGMLVSAVGFAWIKMAAPFVDPKDVERFTWSDGVLGIEYRLRLPVDQLAFIHKVEI